MPELPIPEQLGRRSFQDRSQVVRPSIDLSGQKRFADTVQQVAGNITDRLDQASLRKAKIQFQRMKLEADGSFDQDTDFETYQSRYDEMLGKAAEESSKLIRNSRMQEQFKEEISLYQAEGSQNIKRRALQKETDQGRATLDESLTMARENYLRASSPEDREFARESMMESIDFAQENAYIDADKAQALRQSAAVDLAIASIKVEPADKQIKLLKENKGLIDVIPKDVRLKMIDEAEGQSQTDLALTLASQISSKGGDRTMRLQDADKIQDVKVREMVKQQVEADVNRERRAVADRQYNAYDMLKKGVIEGKTSLEVSKENPELWKSMSGDQQQAIRAMDAKRGESSDLNTYNTLNQLAAKNKDEAYLYFSENAHKLSSSDIKKWSDRLAKPEELDGYLTRSQRLDTALFQIGVKKKTSEDYKLAQDQLDKDVIAFQKERGREPNAEELDKLIGTVTDRVVDAAWYNPLSSDKFGFNLTPEQRKERKVSGKLDRFESQLTEYQNYLSDKSDGVPVILSDDEIDRLYRAWDSKGLLDGN